MYPKKSIYKNVFIFILNVDTCTFIRFHVKIVCYPLKLKLPKLFIFLPEKGPRNPFCGGNYSPEYF